jgi:hypothetical protein
MANIFESYYRNLVNKARQAKRNAAAKRKRAMTAKALTIEREVRELHELRERLRRVEAESKKKRNNEKKARSYFF